MECCFQMHAVLSGIKAIKPCRYLLDRCPTIPPRRHGIPCMVFLLLPAWQSDRTAGVTWQFHQCCSCPCSAWFSSPVTSGCQVVQGISEDVNSWRCTNLWSNVVLLSNDLAAGSLLLSWELGIFFQGWRPSFKGDGIRSVFSTCWEKGKQEGFATASLGQNVAGRRLFAWNSSAGGPGQFPSFLGWPLPFQPGRGKWTNGWICATSTTLVSMLSYQAAMCYLFSVIFAALRKWHKVCSLALW